MTRSLLPVVCLLFCHLHGQSAEDSLLSSGPVKTLYEAYQKGFGSSQTGLIYHHRLDGPKGLEALSSPEEIARGEVRGKSLPWGYGSGIQDIALEDGQVLYALCEAYDATGDEYFAGKAKAFFVALQALAKVSPEPGFVPRGPHPDGKSYYADSSRDQHAAYVEALWRYGQTPFATKEDKQFIADTLGKIAARMERNEWQIMNEDGSARAHVGWAWTQRTTIGAITLLSVLAQAADATGDPHWKELYDQFSEEYDGERWNKWLMPGIVDESRPFTLYSNQFSQAITVLRHIEKNPKRKKQLAEFQRRWAERALQTNVFDPKLWRRLDWSGSEDDEGKQKAMAESIGFDLNKPQTVLELYDSYDRKWWAEPSESIEHRTMQKLGYGLCTVALHGALLSEDPELCNRVRPTVARMVQEFSENQQHYDHGENFNRTVILGLLALNKDDTSSDSTHSAETIPNLPITVSTGWGACMDAEVVGNRLYAIGHGKLHVGDISTPEKPVKLGELSGLGNTRQIVVQDQVAYVSSREDGVFIVDVQDPEKPELLCHYDSIELATGLAIAGDVLFVAQRTFGVEQVDISDPKNPRHLSTVRTGEAQSVDYHDGYLYVGVWAVSEVVVVDMHDACDPRIVSRVPLDGFGDGLQVRDGKLYAATGHHSPAPHAKEGDPGYGHGHGLEIFDLADPANPAFLSRVKFPPFYSIGMDMWGVSVVNDHAFVADTHNGIFLVNVSDPRNPKVVGRNQLPVPEGKDIPALFGGLAVGDGVIYGAGGWTDLHVIPVPEIAEIAPPPTGAAPEIGPIPDYTNDRVLSSYRPSGQVHEVALLEGSEFAVAACGSAGLHVVRIQDRVIHPVSITETGDFVTGICVQGDTIYAAEGSGGLSIWNLTEEGKLSRKGTYAPRGQRIRFVAVPPPGKYALLEIGAARLHIVDVSDPAQPNLVLEDNRHGLFYGYQLLNKLIDGKFTAAFWHVSGIHWYDLSADPPKFVGNNPPGRFGMSDGLALLGDRILATGRQGYSLFDQEETRPIAELPQHRIPGTSLRGKPTIQGDLLYIANRVIGKVTIVDLSDPENPKLLDSYDTPGNPGRIVVSESGYLVPDGYNGLLLVRHPEK